jgi:hypothetical protein
MLDLVASSPARVIVVAMSAIPSAAAILVVAARVRLIRRLGGSAPKEVPAVPRGHSFTS